MLRLRCLSSLGFMVRFMTQPTLADLDNKYNIFVDFRLANLA